MHFDGKSPAYTTNYICMYGCVTCLTATIAEKHSTNLFHSYEFTQEPLGVFELFYMIINRILILFKLWYRSFYYKLLKPDTVGIPFFEREN